MIKTYIYGFLISLIAVPILRLVNRAIGERYERPLSNIYWQLVLLWFISIPVLITVILIRSIKWTLTYLYYVPKYNFRFSSCINEEMAIRYSKVEEFIKLHCNPWTPEDHNLPIPRSEHLEMIVTGKNMGPVKWFIGRWEDAIPIMLESKKQREEASKSREVAALSTIAHKKKIEESYKKLASKF